jgi:hypothetical protein
MNEPNYLRVIPRDLFNEGNLLKCMGRLWIETERFRCVEIAHDGDAFEIAQDSDDGTLTVLNVELRIHEKLYYLRRPMNSREPWPLCISSKDMEEFRVFTDDGNLSEAMLGLIKP